MSKKFPTDFRSARFVTSAFLPEQFPTLRSEEGTPLPEVAVVGRSNAGKSSLINHLVQRRALAKISSTPGKTQTLNFFVVEETFCLVDLPGYGFAKTPQATKVAWGKTVRAYLENRPTLQLILLLVDAKRPLEEEEYAYIDWASQHNKNLLLIFTKTDRLRKEKNPSTLLPHLLYSIKSPHARVKLIQFIREALVSWG